MNMGRVMIRKEPRYVGTGARRKTQAGARVVKRVQDCEGAEKGCRSADNVGRRELPCEDVLRVTWETDGRGELKWKKLLPVVVFGPSKREFAIDTK